MASITKFSFDTNFDFDEVRRQRAAEEQAAPPPPVFSEADVAAARRAGFEEGHEAGKAEVARSVEQMAAGALDVISSQLGSIGPAVTQGLQRCRREAIEIAGAIARKMTAGRAVETVLPSLEAVIGDILPRIIEEPRVVIRVSDDVLDPLQDRISAVKEKSGFPGALILLGEASLEGADCHIEWADGGAEYDTAGLWAEIDGMVERYLAGIGHDDESGKDGAAETAASPGEQIQSEEQPDG